MKPTLLIAILAITLTTGALVLTGIMADGQVAPSNPEGPGPQSITSAYMQDAVEGDPKLTAIDSMLFAGAGVLMIGDGAGKRIVCIDTGDATLSKNTEFKTMEDFSATLAAKLGREGVVIKDMAVNPASGKVYFAIMPQGESAAAILTLDGDGTIGELALNKVRYAELKLSLGEQAGKYFVYDMAFDGERLVVTGTTTKEFGAFVHMVKTPIKHGGDAEVVKVEVFHRSHGNWETAAPLYRIAPYMDGERACIIAGFTCTPVARFALDDIKEGERLKGTTTFDFGGGQGPKALLVYEKDGVTSLLVSVDGWNDVYTARVKPALLGASEATAVNDKAPQGIFDYETGKPVEGYADKIEKLTGWENVERMDKLDAKRACLLKRIAATGKLTFEALDLP